MIYPTQATKQVRLVFRSLRIFTFNGNSEGESSSILIVFSGMKSTSKFPTLKSRQYSAVSFHFRKFAFLVYIDALWRLLILRDFRDRGGGLWNIICYNFVKDRQIFVVLFNLMFWDFSWTCKSISQQDLHVKALFRNTLSFLYVWFCIQWGEHWWNCVLIIMLCKLLDSFDKKPHHLEDDFLLIIILWWVVYTYKIDAKKNILMLCLKCLHNVLKRN